VAPQTQFDRRHFLRRGGSVVAAVGTAALLAPLAGCSDTNSGSAHPSDTTNPTSTTRTTVAGPPDWSVLASTLSGPLVVPTSPSYATDRLLYNERFDAGAPAAIALCRSASDVQRCVAFARQHHVPIAARSGGHSYGGYSSCPGLVIDVTSMAGVSLGQPG
jgi:hypothetical protein